MKQILLAFQFLTIVPVRVAGEVTEEELGGSAAFFPLVGVFQGFVTAVTAFMLIKILPVELAAGLAVLVLILINGGFDLDGLADTADALAVKATGDPEVDRTKRLSVMKDSATGAAGVIALIMTILLKYLLIKSILTGFSAMTSAFVFLFMSVFSKWITVPAIYHGISARNDGLGKIFIDNIEIGHVILSTMVVAVPVILPLFLKLNGLSAKELLQLCLLSIPGCYLMALIAVKFLTKRFGGLTGDHFGALTEISENVFLFAAYLWFHRAII